MPEKSRYTDPRTALIEGVKTVDDDVIKVLDRSYRKRAINLEHIRSLRRRAEGHPMGVFDDALMSQLIEAVTWGLQVKGLIPMVDDVGPSPGDEALEILRSWVHPNMTPEHEEGLKARARKLVERL